MNNRIWHKNGTWNLKIFFSVSAGLHLLFLSGVAFLFPDLKINRLPPLNIEISLLSIVTQERSISLPSSPVKKPPPLPSQPEIKITPMKALALEDAKPEMRDKGEERVDKEPVVQAMTVSSDREASATYQGDKNSEVQASTLPTLSSSGEERKEAKYPSLSAGEILLTQPRYAVNPKPLYPQDARRKGFQGEVVLKVEVLSNGQVGEIAVKNSSGHEILDRSALVAVKLWKFIPARKGESAIPFWVNIPIRFQLQ